MPKNKLQSIKTEGDRERQKKKKKKKKSGCYTTLLYGRRGKNDRICYLFN